MSITIFSCEISKERIFTPTEAWSFIGPRQTDYARLTSGLPNESSSSETFRRNGARKAHGLSPLNRVFRTGQAESYAEQGILILDVDTGCITDANAFLVDLFLEFSRTEMVKDPVGFEEEKKQDTRRMVFPLD